MGLKTWEICKDIRELFNNSVIKKTLVFWKRHDGDWNQFCAALDTIYSTSLAIEKFQSDSSDSFAENKYLLINGILQVLFVQQDAVNFLKTSLFDRDKGIDWEDDRCVELIKIRQIRNETVGHPVKTELKRNKSRYEKDEITSCTIDWSSVTKEGFSYFLWMSSKREERSVEFSKIIEQQDRILSLELWAIVEKMQNEENEHKAKFKGKNLAPLLSSSAIGEDVGFIHRAAWGDSLAWWCFLQYAAAFQDVREGLEDRYWKLEETLRISGTKLVIDKLSFIFSKIESFKNTDEFEAYEFEIYIDALERGIEELRYQLSSIDKEFET